MLANLHAFTEIKLREMEEQVRVIGKVVGHYRVLLQSSFIRVNELGNDFNGVADDAIMGHVENGCIRIHIYGYDLVRLLHSCSVLNRTGNADRNIQFRANCQPALTYLSFGGDEPRVYRSSGAGHLGSYNFGQ